MEEMDLRGMSGPIASFFFLSGRTEVLRPRGQVSTRNPNCVFISYEQLTFLPTEPIGSKKSITKRVCYVFTEPSLAHSLITSPPMKQTRQFLFLHFPNKAIDNQKDEVPWTEIL